MPTVTVRELQKNLKHALLRVERGETLQITRRRPVARLTPDITSMASKKKSEPWPDLAARSAKIMALNPKGKPVDAAQLIIDSRGIW